MEWNAPWCIHDREGNQVFLEELARFLRDKRASDPDFHMVAEGHGPAETEQIASAAMGGGAVGSIRRSAVVEGDGRFFTTPVPDNGGLSGFTHFLDGVQRSRLVGYQGMVPLVYGFTAAVIRERHPDRLLRVWETAVVEECLYAPETEVDVAAFRAAGILVRDTSAAIPAEEEYPAARYRLAATTTIQRARAEAEAQLARRWVQLAGHDESAWLFVDGGLTFATQHARVVGIIKSHQTQYFPATEQIQVLRLQLGERSAVFQPGFGEAKSGDVYSWYMRLHPFSGRDLTFGLIRVEVDRRNEIVSEADTVSSWLMAERQPLSAPDPRWDKLFYPIHDCEEYLRSIAPSVTLMDAMLC